MIEITIDELRSMLKEHIQANYKTQSAFAEQHKCSVSYVSFVVNGKSNFPAKWAEILGARIEKRIMLVAV